MTDDSTPDARHESKDGAANHDSADGIGDPQTAGGWASRGWLAPITKEQAILFGLVGCLVGVIGVYYGLTGTRGPSVSMGPGPSTPQPGASGAARADEPKRAPKTMELLKLGTEAARPQLLADFGPVEEVDGRQAVASSGPAPALRLDVDPDTAGMMLTLVASAAPEAGSQHVTLLLDEKEIGVVHVEVPWTRARLALPPNAIRPGPHVLTFRLEERVKAQTKALRFESLQVEPLPTWADVLLPAASAKPLLVKGWSYPERDGKRLAVWSDGDQSHTQLLLRPRAAAYRLGLIARGADGLPGADVEVAVEINQRKVGSIQVSKSREAYHLSVPTDALRSGANVVVFRYDATIPHDGQTPGQPRRVAVMAERIYLRPVAETLNVDFGHPDDRAFLLSGFTPDPPWGQDRRFVFSEGELSKLSFPLEPADASYRLELSAFAFEPLAPVDVEVVVNGGEPVGTVELGKEEKTLSVDIPQGRLVAGTNTLGLRYSKTAKPSEIVEGSEDVRELAAGLVAAHIRPAR